jgi:hypothetical protein
MAGQMLVVTMQWSEGSTARQETYGPWTAAEDESHLEQIVAFLKDWRKATGCEPSSATLAVVTDPQQFPEPLPAFIQVPEDWTPERIAEFRKSWDRELAARFAAQAADPRC